MDSSRLGTSTALGDFRVLIGGFQRGSRGVKGFLGFQGFCVFWCFLLPGAYRNFVEQGCYLSRELKIVGSGVLGSHGLG